MTQQYTCPKCLKNYVKATIHEHYECGVEPLDETEAEIDERIAGVMDRAKIRAEEIISNAEEDAKDIIEEAAKADETAAAIIAEAKAEASEIINKAMEEAKRIKEQAQEPKKRGPKPKNKLEGAE